MRANLPSGIAYLVLAGEIVGEITDPQLRRRVFTFEQLLYPYDEGKLAIDLDQVELQLRESEGEREDTPPKLPKVAETLANYYCTQAFALLRRHESRRNRRCDEQVATGDIALEDDRH